MGLTLDDRTAETLNVFHSGAQPRVHIVILTAIPKFVLSHSLLVAIALGTMTSILVVKLSRSTNIHVSRNENFVRQLQQVMKRLLATPPEAGHELISRRSQYRKQL